MYTLHLIVTRTSYRYFYSIIYSSKIYLKINNNNFNYNNINNFNYNNNNNFNYNNNTLYGNLYITIYIIIIIINNNYYLLSAVLLLKL